MFVCIACILCVCVNVGINVSILTMHVNVIMGDQLDEHSLFWQPNHLYNIIFCTAYIVLLFEVQIKSDDVL